MLKFKAQFDREKFCTAWSIKKQYSWIRAKNKTQPIKPNQKVLKVKEGSNRRVKPVTLITGTCYWIVSFGTIFPYLKIYYYFPFIVLNKFPFLYNWSSNSASHYSQNQSRIKETFIFKNYFTRFKKPSKLGF